jgi:ribosomal-protein-alanine N-acetyltransferase
VYNTKNAYPSPMPEARLIQTDIYNAARKPKPDELNRLVDFLYEHLEQYGDEREAIKKAIQYALKDRPSFGGFVAAAKEGNQIIGVVVINQTGMDGYIPENILVYIATHAEMRGKGIGKSLMDSALKYCNGSIALHVEPDNPAKNLYEKYGFTNKYLEMRLER